MILDFRPRYNSGYIIPKSRDYVALVLDKMSMDLYVLFDNTMAESNRDINGWTPATLSETCHEIVNNLLNGIERNP